MVSTVGRRERLFYMKRIAASNRRAVVASFVAAAMAVSMMVPATALASQTPGETLPQEGVTYTAGTGATKASYKIVSNGSKTCKYVACQNKNAAKIKIPATITIKGVTYKVVEVAKSACKGAKATTITVGKNVKIIRNRAFLNCTKVTKVNIKTTKLTKIASRAFKGTKSLKSLTVKSAKVTKIGPKAFQGSAVKTLKIKTTKLTKSGVKGALKGSKVKTVKAPASKVKKYTKILPKRTAVKAI